LGDALGYSLAMDVGGWACIGGPNEKGTDILKASIPALVHPGTLVHSQAWDEAPNWLLRHYGRQVGIVFPIATSNDAMRQGIQNAVEVCNQDPNIGFCRALPRALANESKRIDIHSQVPSVLISFDSDREAEYLTYCDDDCEWFGMEFEQPFAIHVAGDPGVVESAIASIGGINPRASALLRSAIHEGKRAKLTSDNRVKGLLSLVDSCRKEVVDSHRLIDSVRSLSDSKFEAPADSTEVDICGRGFPAIGSDHAPNPIAGYTLDAWTASVKMGHRPEDCAKYDASDLLDSIIADKCVRLVGPPGTGKTSVVRELAARVGVPYFVVTCHRDLPDEQFFGCYQIIDGEQVWVDGEFTQAMRCNEPLAFCAIEEGDHLDATKQSKMHAPLNGDDFVPGNGESLAVPVGMRFIMTANTSGHGDVTGRHGAAMTSDSAFNSRWQSTFHVDYLDPRDEVVLLIANGLSADEASQFVAFAGASRCVDQESSDGMSEPVCLRHTLSYARMRGRGVPPRKAFGLSVLGHLSEYDRKPCNELAITHVSAISCS